MIASLVAVASAVLVVTLAVRRGWGWTAPMNLYVVVWAAAVLIYSLRLFPFYDLSPATWMLVAAAGAALVLGVFCGGRHRAHAAGLPRVDGNVGNDLDVPLWLVRLFLVIGLAGFAVFLSAVHRAYGLSVFFQLPLLVHNAISNRYISSSYLFPYYFGVAGTILFGYRLIVRRWRPGVADLLLLLGFVLAMALSTERNHFLWCLASWMFCCFLPPAGDRSLRRIVAGGVVAALIGISFYLGVGQWLNKSPENISETLRLIVEREKRLGHLLPWLDDRLFLLLPGGQLHRFAVLYVALGEPLPSLDQAIKSPERTHGAMTFRPIVRALARAGLVTDVVSGSTYDEVPTPYPSNAYTFLFEPYRDFGWPGAIILPALLGLLLGYAYRTSASRGGGPWALVLTQMQGMVLWAPFQNRFVLTVSWYICALLLAGCLAGPLGARARRAVAALPARTRRVVLWLGAVLGAASVVAGVVPRRTEPPRPIDLVIVTIDTLRVDHVGAYGGPPGATPAIDRFAASGLVFDRAVAPASVTGPSLATLLTSHYPHETQITDNGLPLPRGVLTLPELLRRAGYQTVAVLSNPVLRPPGDFPQGFDVYDTDLPQTELGRPVFKERRADATTDRVLRALKDRNPNRRLFLWVHYIDPHGPYAPPDARPAPAPADEPLLRVNSTNTGRGGIPKYQYIWNERSPSLYRGRYKQEISFLDAQLARLFEALDQPVVRDRTLVIFTADHGESLGEHDYYFAHGEYLYPESIDVPFIVRGPGLGTGRRHDLVGLVDVLPSVAAYLHVPLHEPVRGAAVFEHPAPGARVLLAVTYPNNSLTERVAAIRAEEELIYSAPTSVELLRGGKPVSFDTRSASFLAFGKDLKRLIQENQLTGVSIADRPALTDEAAERLRGLGYIR
jgi:arylsulfatase A-like enzyme